MKTTREILILLLSAALLSLAASNCPADAGSDALKKKFEDRYPALRAAKDAGKVGEVYTGFIDAVDPKFMEDAAIKKLISDENDDRKMLYKSLADQAQATPDVVAERAAKRNFDTAKPTDYLKDKDGKWKKKSA